MHLRHDLLGVAAEVGERRTEVQRQELDQQRVGMGERKVEVDRLFAFEFGGVVDHVHDRAVVAVRQHAALRRAGGAGGVDEGVGVLELHGLASRGELLEAAGAAALADLVERDRAEGACALAAGVGASRSG